MPYHPEISPTIHSLRQEGGIINETRQKLATVVAIAGIALAGAVGKDVVKPPQADASLQTTEAISPETLGQQASLLIATTAKAWANHQTPDGRFVDPGLGMVNTYGSAMIGQAMVETGAALNDEALIDAGIRALLAQTKNPDNDGFNVGFEVFGMSEAVASNDKALANNPSWQNTRNTIVNFIQARSSRKPSGIVGKAFERGDFSNLRILQTVANMSLNAAGINTATGARAASANGQTVSAANPELLAQTVKHTSKNARRLGGMQISQAGILSDPTVNPLAYHALSSMFLGRIIEKQGYENSSSAVRAAFMRSAKGLVGIMAPNGDVSFVGRGQAQLWNLGASADALAMAAKYETNPEWRGRYLASYARVINLLQTEYTPGPHGMPVIPRHKGEVKPSHKGLERYVSTVGYNGLALNALAHSVSTLKDVSATLSQGIASDYEGVFVDPTQAKFATVRKGNLWYAIHGSTTNKDARYGFGIMAAQRIEPDGSARNIMPHRPYTKDVSSGGPVIKMGGKELVPVAQKMSAKANGTVTIVGGWSSIPNRAPSTDRNTKMTFKPESNNGVSFGFIPKKSRTYEFEMWGEKGAKFVISANSLTITEHDGDHIKYSFSGGSVKIKPSHTSDYSSYEALTSYTATVKGKAGKHIGTKTIYG